MNELFIQLIGLTLLIVGLGTGYWLAARRYAGKLRFAQKGLLLLVVLTMAGGFIGAFAWWVDAPAGFAWDLPPLASRMLAAAGWAFALACLLALRSPTRQHLRLISLMLTIYLLPLTVAILLFHLDRFDPAAPITYAFFTIVAIMTIAALWYLLRPAGVLKPRKQEQLRPTRTVQSWLWVVAVGMGLWGVALFATAQGPISLIWVWPQDLLASRLIAVMLLTIAGAALYSLRLALLARTTLALLVVYGIGVALAGWWNLLAGKPVPPAYVVLFASTGLLSGVLLLVGVTAHPSGRSTTAWYYDLIEER
jgi:hypothetical protein